MRIALLLALVACTVPSPVEMDAGPVVADAAFQACTTPLGGIWHIRQYCLGGCFPDAEPEEMTHLRITDTAVSLGTCTPELDCTWRYRAAAAADLDECIGHARFDDADNLDLTLLSLCPRNPPWMTGTMTWYVAEDRVEAEILGQHLTPCPS